MGAELTDPLKSCCCANTMKLTLESGGNTDYTFEDRFNSNIDFIVRIQARMRAKLYSIRYKKRRDDRRKKSSHFKAQDQMETLSRYDTISISLFYEQNEADLERELFVGTYNYKTTGASYEGQWLGGFRHGRGIMKFADGATYEGQWFLGRAHGKGKFTHVQGETYEGDWVDDMRHGKGLSIHVNQFRY